MKTLFAKVWDAHVVADLGGGVALLHIDRHLQHDLGGGRSLESLRKRGLKVRNPELTFATADHVVETEPGVKGSRHDWAIKLLDSLRTETKAAGVRLFDVGEDGQGIVHVVAPELGITLPGLTAVCGDSHTCTNGGIGAMGFGIGATEIVHVLATQCLVQSRPRTMSASFDGERRPGVHAKDLILALAGRIGTAGGVGHAIEYAGPAIRALGVEERLTLCNLTVELGAKIGMVAPDATTIDWLRGRRFAPKDRAFDAAAEQWLALATDAGASFDREVALDASAIAPQVTWGTSPEDVIAVDGRIPSPASDAKREALAYMGLDAGAPLAGTKVDRVFIGSCTNSRLPDLRAAAAVAKGRKVAKHVRAWVVPGSVATQRAAEAEGLHEIFRAAGFEWRDPGCSLCVGANGELVEREARCVSTSNRNFVGRQGPGARTHLASPVTAAASAIAGAIADPREFLS